MSEETVVATPAAAASPKTPSKGAKKGKKTGPAKTKKTVGGPAHPKIAVMVNTAISTLKERGGSSLQAIKKYIAANYKVDVERMAPFIKKYLKTAVEKGGLVQTKGKGATGSFRLSAGVKGAETEKKPKAKKAPKPKAVVKKPAKAKKTVEKKVAAKPKAAPPKAKPVPKSPKKKPAAKPKKAKVTKPKSPKVKKAKSPAKKASAKK